MQPDSPQVTIWPRGTDRVYQANTSGAGNVFASSIGTLTSAKFSTVYGPGIVGGEDLLEFVLAPSDSFVGGLVRPGDHVAFSRSGAEFAVGEMSEALPSDDGSWSFTIKGYRYNFYDYDAEAYIEQIAPAPDSYFPTLSFDDAWNYAHDDLLWPIRTYFGLTFPVGSYGESPYSGSSMSDTFYKMGDLLVNIITQDAKKAACWGRSLVVGADDLSPLWLYHAPAGVVGVADTDYVTHLTLLYTPDPGDPLYGTYILNPDGSMAVVAIDVHGLDMFDVRTTFADWRTYGPQWQGAAGAVAQNLLDQVKGRFHLSGSFTVNPDSGFQHIGGGFVTDLTTVVAGRAIQLPGVLNDQGNLLATDTFMIGQTQWEWSAGEGDTSTESLTITPMGSVPRDIASILAAPDPEPVVLPFQPRSRK